MLPVEGVEQGHADLLRTGREIVQALAAVARDTSRGHIEIARQIKRHRSVQDATDGREMTVAAGGPDPLDHLVNRIGVGEDVVRRLPVSMLVGIAEARDPERRRVSKRSAKVGRSRAGADRRLERVNDPGRIVTEQLLRERRMVRPAGPDAAGSEQFRHLADCSHHTGR